MQDYAGYLFHQGTNSFAYDYLGCHLKKADGKFCYTFRTWAPNAKHVYLVGDAFGWNNPQEMTRFTDRGVFELSFSSNYSLECSAYKFLIEGQNGQRHYKGDPYARFSRGKADGASLVFCEDAFKWEDSVWLTHRKATICSDGESYLATPINIYEVHFESFLRSDGGEPLSYREMADKLIPYVKTMGYTHIEFLPLAEYPFDGSWGYQVGAFYAVSSRFGTPTDFKYFVNTAHQNGIGILLDWVPAHFPKDEWGLFEFDGQPLYEYQGTDRMESPSWGTRFFDLGREEVQSFLISNALYYLREFHIDGLRVDAVAAMLYLDYDRKPGEWIPNRDGGRENLEAIAFFKKLNGTVLSEIPDVLMIAEESTAFPGVTHPTDQNGLGFSLKWNMGFANDLYDYLSLDPIGRQYNHNALTFPIMYAFSENYVLPISHDEVVHGKKSFIDKCYGEYEDKFSEARTALLMLMTFPGKKMLFMGTEYAQFREWDFANSLEWFMLDYPNHATFRDYVRALNFFYLSHSELYDDDFRPNGFSWISVEDKEKNTIVFRRINRKGDALTVVLNYSGAQQTVSLQKEAGSRFSCVFATDISVEDDIKRQLKPKTKNERAEISIPRFSGAVLTEIKKIQKIKIPKYEI